MGICPREYTKRIKNFRMYYCGIYLQGVSCIYVQYVEVLTSTFIYIVRCNNESDNQIWIPIETDRGPQQLRQSINLTLSLTKSGTLLIGYFKLPLMQFVKRTICIDSVCVWVWFRIWLRPDGTENIEQFSLHGLVEDLAI